MNQTNTENTRMAGILSEVGNVGQGTLISLMVRKKGCTRGPASKRVIYGDDFVHVLLWTGFHYAALVQRSHKKLHELWGKGNFVSTLLAEVHKTGYMEATVKDSAEAIQETDEALLKVINGVLNQPEDDSGTDVPEIAEDDPKPVWEPLKVDGVTVLGAKVYIGEGDKDNPRAPVPGMIYLDGVKLGEKVLTPAANGPWKPKKKAKTVAKDILRSWLPVGLYARYCLNPEQTLSVAVGQKASNLAKESGVQVDPEAIRSLFKIAP